MILENYCIFLQTNFTLPHAANDSMYNDTDQGDIYYMNQAKRLDSYDE